MAYYLWKIGVLDEVLRLSRLVHDVLDLSRLEAGMAEMNPQTENLMALLEDLLSIIRLMAENKGIHLLHERR